MHTVAHIISQYARKYGIDPRAALAVARTEGGLRWGAVGDQGTSFGPYQLHVGGALPAGRGAAWANSPAGIEYALRSMARAGARGKRGSAAINAIVRNFERPADPDAQVAKALGYYGSSVPVGGGRAQGQTPGMGGGLDRQALALSLLQSMQSGQPLGTAGLLNTVLGARQTGQASGVSGGRSPALRGARSSGGLVRPLGTKLTGGSEFGISDPEGAPSKRGGRYHAGKDWFAPGGAAVRSPVNGRIVEVKASRGNSGQVFGGVVKVQAPNGRVFVFRHVDPRGVKVGQRVNAGALIATVTNWASGSSHAHIEVWKSLEGGYRMENMIDPVRIFR